LPERVGSDVRVLIERAGRPYRGASELTTLRSSVLERPAWRVDLEGGRSVKVRVFADADEAHRFRELHRHLPEKGFPRLLDHHGAAVLLEWVAGRPLPAEPDASVLRACGELLGRLHRVPAPPDAERRLASGASALPHSLADLFETLVEAARLTADEAARLLEVSERARPERCDRGLVHLDFCPDNLVLADSGTPASIDNATLSFAPLDHDLGRLWYRWPMTSAARGAFLEGYREHRDTRAFQAAFPYWRICGLAFSAWLRVGRRTGDAAVPLRGLREALAWAERMSPAELADPARLPGLP
jgi:Ser/Thr protein kinase RdoA (MazF antagonist)